MRVDASGWTCVKRFLRSGEAQRIVQLAPPTPAYAATYELARDQQTGPDCYNRESRQGPGTGRVLAALPIFATSQATAL